MRRRRMGDIIITGKKRVTSARRRRRALATNKSQLFRCDSARSISTDTISPTLIEIVKALRVC